jgi:hypothetical protein
MRSVSYRSDMATNDDLRIDATGNIVTMTDVEWQKEILHRVQLAMLTSIDLKIAEERPPEYGLPPWPGMTAKRK